MIQSSLDKKNVVFWNDLCGSWLARSLGITQNSPESLYRFDKAYFAFYPYLKRYVAHEDLEDKKVLEIGLGYGTLGQYLASKASDYYGIDIADGPIAMMSYRLSQLLQGIDIRVSRGSALAIPHADDSFDYVYSIGSLHHTGNLEKAISEVYRVLVPGGKAIVMIYNRYSFRRLLKIPLKRLKSFFQSGQIDIACHGRAFYDVNSRLQSAPHTDFISRSECQRLFKKFAPVKIDVHNFDHFSILGRTIISREKLLGNIGRILGLDLYVTAIK